MPTSRDEQFVLVASGFGDDGRGGLFVVEGDRVETVDTVPTTGLCLADELVARLVRAPAELTSTAELVVYDERGVRSYQRLDAVRDPHDVIRVENVWIAISTDTNAVIRIENEREEVVWQATDVPDALHLNCVTVVSDEMWLSAFGRFQTFRGWAGEQAKGTGILWNSTTGAEISGLSHPHTPRFVENDWFVCESLLGVVTQFSATGELTRRCDLGGYTRGLAFNDTTMFVGVSGRRKTAENAYVAAIDRQRFTCDARVELPCSEIYDLLFLPRDLLKGLRAGFDTNPYRVSLGASLTAANASPLRSSPDPALSACGIAAAIPSSATAHTHSLLTVVVENQGRQPIASLPPEPVLVASRWIDESGNQIDGNRVPLREVLEPGARGTVRLPIEVPPPGRYRLVISLVCELRFWFDDLDPAFAASSMVDVTGSVQ